MLTLLLKSKDVWSFLAKKFLCFSDYQCLILLNREIRQNIMNWDHHYVTLRESLTMFYDQKHNSSIEHVEAFCINQELVKIPVSYIIIDSCQKEDLKTLYKLYDDALFHKEKMTQLLFLCGYTGSRFLFERYENEHPKIDLGEENRLNNFYESVSTWYRVHQKQAAVVPEIYLIGKMIKNDELLDISKTHPYQLLNLCYLISRKKTSSAIDLLKTLIDNSNPVPDGVFNDAIMTAEHLEQYEFLDCVFSKFIPINFARFPKLVYRCPLSYINQIKSIFVYALDYWHICNDDENSFKQYLNLGGQHYPQVVLPTLTYCHKHLKSNKNIIKNLDNFLKHCSAFSLQCIHSYGHSNCSKIECLLKYGGLDMVMDHVGKTIAITCAFSYFIFEHPCVITISKIQNNNPIEVFTFGQIRNKFLALMYGNKHSKEMKSKMMQCIKFLEQYIYVIGITQD
jgi:hypothetical protein